jgi:hypothetical protein
MYERQSQRGYCLHIIFGSVFLILRVLLKIDKSNLIK